METNDIDVMEPDEMEANMRAEEHRVEVDFGDFVKLGDTSADKGYASKYSSTSTSISPCALDKRLKEIKQTELDCES